LLPSLPPGPTFPFLFLLSFAFALWPLPFLAFCGEPLLGIWKRSGKKAKDREQENGKKEGKGTEEETKRNKRKQRTEKPEDKLYFIFVLVFLFVFFSFLFLCPLLTYLISVYKSLETKRKT